MDDEEKDPEYNYLAEVDDLIDSDEELRDDRAVKISSQFVILFYLLWKDHQLAANVILYCQLVNFTLCNFFAMYSYK